MTNIFTAFIIAGIAGAGAFAGSNGITEDTGVSIKVAVYITVLTGSIVLWLDKQFNGLKAMYKNEHERNKIWRLWVRSSIQILQREAKVEPLPLPDEDSNP